MATEPCNTETQPRLSIRLDHIDYTLAPSGPLDNTSLPLVPTIRIFGVSSTGESTCAHIHQVYPYLYIEYTGGLDAHHVKRYIATLSSSLNHAVAASFKSTPSVSRFIRAVLLVKGVHFYGFHSSYSPFLKILVANPAHVHRISIILQSGTVMSTRFRVYESHLSYVLQFMCDFGLYGCGFINVKDAVQRCPSQNDEEFEHGKSSILEAPRISFESSPYARTSRVPLEVDVIAPHIFNRHRLKQRLLHHELKIPANPSPPEPLVISVRELWDDERARRKARGLDPSPKIPADPTKSSRVASTQWVAEAKWWEEIQKRLETEREHLGAPANPTGWERWTMTSFESVEALWKEHHRRWKPLPSQHGEDLDSVAMPPTFQNNFWDNLDEEIGDQESDLEVDLSMLLSEELEELAEIETDNDSRDIRSNYTDSESEHEDEDEDAEEVASADEEEDETVNEGDVIHKEADNGNGENMNESEEEKDDASSDSTNTATGIRIRRTESSVDTRSLKSNGYNQQTQLKLRRLTSSVTSPPATKNSLSQSQCHSIQTPTKSISPFNRNIQPLINGGTMNLQAPLKLNSTKNYTTPMDQLSSRSDGINSTRHQRKARFLTPSREADEIPQRTLAENMVYERARTEDILGAITACKAINLNRYNYNRPPPTATSLLKSMEELGIPSKVYRAPYFSDADDITELPRECLCAALTCKDHGQDVGSLSGRELQPHVDFLGSPTSINKSFKRLIFPGWEYAGHPPAAKEIRTWLSAAPNITRKQQSLNSQIEGPTQSKADVRHPSNTGLTENIYQGKESMSILSLEIFAPSEGGCLVPDPEIDAIAAAFYAFHVSGTDTFKTGIIAIITSEISKSRLRDVKLDVVKNELDVINEVIDVVLELDPDIVVGWEIQCNSWGYFESRGASYGLDITELLSRAPPRRNRSNDVWGSKYGTSINIAGRHVLNLWRIIRSEKRLTSYTFENAAFQVLGKRVPHYSIDTLTNWYNSTTPMHAFLLVSYFASRTKLNLQMLEEAEIVTKTAYSTLFVPFFQNIYVAAYDREFSRVFGVDFFSVITRGSQFKVESFMFRIAKPENLILLSPSKHDVGKQNAAECMPLIMEPVSSFYSSPLVVLDFQSLYPSVMIAYNYCYSTCLGRVNEFQGSYKLGVTDLNLPVGLLEKLKGHISVAPNGIMYVKPEVRRGLLGRMLVELLETRVMIKQAMKGVGTDIRLKKILDARQLGLKYIANVTYGYTGATMSGRMPAVEIADSIVQSGREILEKAVNIIDTTPKWGAQVVYGDTDSVFVYLKGKTREQAFVIGNDIADRITAVNPVPIKLKFEKVYHPCILLSKKRYVGFKYESPDEHKPVFDAKGIETVRRDGVLAQKKMVETCLKLLFRTQDLSQVKEYCLQSWTKILENRVSTHDFIFTKEVRMANYSDDVLPPPGAAVAARKMSDDPNYEPQYGDRIPYVIVEDDHRKRLSERAMDPLELAEDRELRLDATYYISRVLIPPLERIFTLVGANVRQWYLEIPSMTSTAEEPSSPENITPTKGTATSPIDDGRSPPSSAHQQTFGELDDAKSCSETGSYEPFDANRCVLCEVEASDVLCDRCRDLPQQTISNLGSSIRRYEMRFRSAHQICVSCTGVAPVETVQCDSIDCPWLFARKRAENDIEAATFMKNLTEDMEIEAYEMEELRNNPDFAV